MKKVLSLVLVLSMILSSMSFAFAGESFEDVADTDYAEAIETLVALGVVTGYEDGTYRPERTVTRAEMAKLMVELLGYGDLVAGSKSNFADTQGHWADAWIALAAGRGIAIGDPNGSFRPDDTVTYDEVYTMLVRGLGYTDDCNELKGMTWPTNFKVKAAELGIIKGVNMDTTGADRGGVAQAMANALEATLVTVTTDGDVTFLVDSYNGEEYNRILLTRLADPAYNYVISEDRLDPDNKNYGGDLVDLAPYMFQSLEVYLNDDDEVVYVNDVNSLVIEGSVDEVTLSSNGKIATVAVETAEGSIKKVDFTVDETDGLDTVIPSSISLFENRGSLSEATFAYLEDTESIKIVANEGQNSNGKIEEAEVDGFVLETQTFVVRIEEEYEEDDDKLDGLTLPTNSKDEVDLRKVMVKGDANSLEDIEIDDIVVEYIAEDDAFTTLVVSRDAIEGTVTRQGGTDVYVDGTKYKLSETAGAVSAPSVGDTGIFYLDHNGKIVDIDAEGTGATDYAVVIGAEIGTIAEKFNKKSIDDYPQIKLVTQEGDEVVYDLHIKLNSSGDVSSSVKVDGDNLFVDADVADENLNADNEFAEAKVEGLVGDNAQGSVIKYRLNSDNRITRIETISAQNISDVDTTKSSFKLAENALIYDTDEAEAVDSSKLKSLIDGYAVYNKSGEIEVLLTADIDEVQYSFAYITKTEDAIVDGDEVQALVAYTNGKKVDPLYTDADDVVQGGTNAVYAIDVNGDDQVVEATTSTAISGLTVYEGTISARGSNTIKFNNGWHTLADDATIIEVESDGDVKAVRKLNSIVVDRTEVTVYLYDGYVAFVVIHE